MDDTSSDGLISTFEGFEVGSQLFKFRFTAFGGDNLFICEDDGFSPLHIGGYTYVIFSS